MSREGEMEMCYFEALLHPPIRWDKLCAESEAKKKRLTTAHAHFLEIEKLFQVINYFYYYIISFLTNVTGISLPAADTQ